MWVEGCPEGVSPSCRNEKDSGAEAVWNKQSGQAKRQGEGTAWPPPGAWLTAHAASGQGWLSGSQPQLKSPPFDPEPRTDVHTLGPGTKTQPLEQDFGDLGRQWSPERLYCHSAQQRHLDPSWTQDGKWSHQQGTGQPEPWQRHGAFGPCSGSHREGWLLLQQGSFGLDTRQHFPERASLRPRQCAGRAVRQARAPLHGAQPYTGEVGVGGTGGAWGASRNP